MKRETEMIWKEQSVVKAIYFLICSFLSHSFLNLKEKHTHNCDVLLSQIRHALTQYSSIVNTDLKSIIFLFFHHQNSLWKGILKWFERNNL